MDVDNRTADVAAKPLRLLIVEDSPKDAEIVVRLLLRGGFDVTWKQVETAEAMRAALDAEPWDAIVSDYRMPNFDGLEALLVFQEKKIDIPFIIVSGAIGEETAIAVMKAGAHDYVMKDKMARLAMTIEHELGAALVRHEKLRLEEGMREAARQWRTTFDAMNDAICIIDQDLRIVRSNRAFRDLVDKPWDKILGQTCHSIVHGCAAPIADCPVVRARESLHRESLVLEMKGRWWALAADPVLDNAGQLIDLVHVMVDVTEQRAAEAELRESEERFRRAIQATEDGLWEWNIQTNQEFFAPRWCEIIGYSFDDPEFPHTFKKWAERIHPHDYDRVIGALNKHLENGPKFNVEYRHRHKSGEYRWQKSRGQAIFDESGKPVKMVGCISDITESKRTEAEVRERMKELWALYSLAEMAQREGIPLEELYKEFTNILPKSWLYAEIACARMVIDDKEFRTENFAESPWMQSAPIMVNGELVGRIEVGYLEERPEEGEGPFLEEKRFLIDAIAKQLGQITESKRAEEKLLNLMQHQELILSSTAEGILGLDLQGKHTFINLAAAKILGYETEELLGRFSHSLWHHTKLDGSPFPEEECAIYATLREGTMYRKSTELFWRKDGTCFPVEYASTPIYEKGRLAGAVVTFVDITERKQAEKQLQKTLESLRKAVDTTIQVMVSAVEIRDPYTAGHQTRSAALAGAMATEMGLSQENIDGIRMAGSIHDIGKLSIPAEILSKPTRLSEIELLLIKEHANRGYEMLKDVESPWPLAEIVYQHHEQMDGSGYPRNLKGEEIMIEARILAVADVVEAMASHRPYRPGLGIDKALEEISQNKGVLYDPEVVEVCLRLFREKGFKF